MSAIRWLIFGLFFPACLILLGQVIWSAAIAQQILALALLLLCIEQSRAATLDLEAVLLLQEHVEDPRLPHFYRLVIVTIVLELCGFYGAWIGLGFGGLLVLFSQIGFHGLAQIRLETEPQLILPWGLAQRSLILCANSCGVILLALWIEGIAPVTIATILLGLVILYEGLKYFSPGPFRQG